MKLYAKIKINGKWTMVSAATVAARVEAHERCECTVCHAIRNGCYEGGVTGNAYLP